MKYINISKFAQHTELVFLKWMDAFYEIMYG